MGSYLVQLGEKGEHRRRVDLTADGFSVHGLFQRWALLLPFFGPACGVSQGRPDIGLTVF